MGMANSEKVGDGGWWESRGQQPMRKIGMSTREKEHEATYREKKTRIAIREKVEDSGWRKPMMVAREKVERKS